MLMSIEKIFNDCSPLQNIITSIGELIAFWNISEYLQEICILVTYGHRIHNLISSNVLLLGDEMLEETVKL